MNQKIVVTAVFLLSLFLIAACTPTEVEPESGDRIADRVPSRPPIPTASLSTTPLPLIELPLNPDDGPTTLPIYVATHAPVLDDEAGALAWAQAFGLTNGEIGDSSEEAISILSLDETGQFFEQLTFVHADYGQYIYYSNGTYWGDFSGPTPLPSLTPQLTLPPEMVTEAALSFVREHNLLQEPIIAHELPGIDENYTVSVSYALQGLRVKSFEQDQGVIVRIDGNGRVIGASISPASFAIVESKTVRPLDQIYEQFVQGTSQSTFYYEWERFGQMQLDPMRFHTNSMPYGDRGDRVELVYASLPTQPELMVPMWLITRPHGDSWDHYDEYYLLAIEGDNLNFQPGPSPTPLMQTDVVVQSLNIVPPILVDGENGRLYTNAVVDNIVHTVSLDATTGELLAVFGLTGDLALDAGRNLLFVDKYLDGLTVIDTTTGEVVNEIRIPAIGPNGYNDSRADPATGNVLLFRNEMLLIADPLSESWQHTIPITVEGTACGQSVEEPEPWVILQTWFDQTARLLYLLMGDDDCESATPRTVVVYDMNTMSEIARYTGMEYLSGVAVNGRFYGKSAFDVGGTFYWAWQDGLPWLDEIERAADLAGSISGFQVDENRGWLYEMTVNGLQILDMETMAVVRTLPAPVDGLLVGFDSVTDNLYFVEGENGRLLVWSAENIQN